jgi:uncharacterized protein (TIGR02284 family)
MALSTDKIIEECNDLIRFDYDAIGAYDEAIDTIKMEPLNGMLIQFRGDHERHVVTLSGIVQRLGGKPVDKPGARGVIRKTMTKVAGLVGVEPTLKAMQSNEEVLNKQYRERSNMAFPADVLGVIQRHYADEQRHLQWVQQQLMQRTWEHAPAHP